MIDAHIRGLGRARAVLLVLLLVVVVVGCAPTSTTHGATDSAAAPELGRVQALEDPKSWRGPSHAPLPQVAIEPISTSPKQTLPAKVVDTQGTKVTVVDTSRILALDIYGTLSQTVFELGLGDSVVGRDLSTQFEEAQELPLVTGESSHELIAEKILALDPTVILTDTSLGPWDVILQMRDAGIPVVVVDSKRGLENLASLTEEIADALGVPAEGKKLGKRIETDAQNVAAAIAKVAPQELTDKLRMVFLYVRGQAGVYYMFGEGSGADSLIDSLGGYNVTEEIDWKGMKPVTDEAIVAAQPDLILMMTKGLESVGGVDGLLERIPALANTPAGQNKRIVDMADTGILSFGPRTAEVLNSLAVATYAPVELE